MFVVVEWFQSPIFGLSITLLLYWLSLKLSNVVAWLHPLLTCSAAVIVVLVTLGIPYKHYMIGGEWITLLLGPATVALAVPLHTHWRLIHRHLLPIIAGIVTGVGIGFASNALLIHAFRGSDVLLFTVLPKSATAPISIEVVGRLGGIPELGAVFSVLTGLFGSLAGSWFLGRVGVRTDLAIGIAMGTAAHGIGTAKLLRDSEHQGAYSSLAMGITGILISAVSMFV